MKSLSLAMAKANLTGLHLSAEAINSLLERMLKPSGRRVDLSSPFVDASLPDGSRLHAVIPDITRRHTSINIRKSWCVPAVFPTWCA